MQNNTNKSPNSLINETSPYLLQHAYNPVNWLAFSQAAFDKAKRENKPVLISIGYSACHWCHVMEHESFEDEQTAALMNEHFINIKVDREERSDVDMLYMQAVQLMTGQGGWPLNCFVLPNGRPFYGGTYFRKEQWQNILKNLADLYTNDPQRINQYADELTIAIKKSELLVSTKNNNSPIQKAVLNTTITNWKTRLDNEHGGPNRAPKFPLPSNYKFLLRYAVLENDTNLLDYVNLTLTKMAFGGIYDQLHGGFARYSTDVLWKVPHFEKMLYDNSQLVALYAEAYVLTKNELYKEIAIDALNFVEKEWLTEEGCFYSAFDADSDGEEGKYYVWNELDLKELLGDDFNVFSKYFEINDTGYWEHGNYILMRAQNLSSILVEFNLSKQQLSEKISNCKEILKQEVKSRIKPGLDDKSITSWNAMMCKGFADAYLSFDEERFKNMALRSIHFILSKLSTSEGTLYRTYKNGTAKIDGFLEDYAFTIEALMSCYLISQDENYLLKAKQFTEKSLELFHNPESDFLFYTAKHSEALVARTTEISDNVMPASNSQMAINLYYLGTYFGIKNWVLQSQHMLQSVLEDMQHYGSGYSNWGCLALHFVYPNREIAIVGKHVDEKLLELYKHGLTNTIFAVHQTASDLPLLKNRFINNETLIYVCKNNTCQLPVSNVNEALKHIV